MMRFGLAGLQAGRGCEPDGLAEVARLAESLGFESLWAAEHVIIPERVTSRYPFNAEGKLHNDPTAVGARRSTSGYCARCGSQDRVISAARPSRSRTSTAHPRPSTGRSRLWCRAHPTPQPGERDGSGTDTSRWR